MLFLSTYHNRVDKKGRVSVPAPFRAVLAGQEFQGIILTQSLINPCLEASGMDRLQKLSERMEQLDPFSEERDAFATTLFGESLPLAFDSEGRVMIPETMLDAAAISEQAVFVGKGDIFEIWMPDAFSDYAAKARATAIAVRHQLRSDKP